VFDESFTTDTAHGGGRVAAIVIGPKVKAGFKSTALYQHQNILRTALDALGVKTYPGKAISAGDMADFFGSTSTSPPPYAGAPVGCTVASAAAGSTADSSVHCVAAASSTHPIAMMRIYIDNAAKFTVNANSLNTSLAVPDGTHSVVVQAWDSNGAVFKTPL